MPPNCRGSTGIAGATGITGVDLVNLTRAVSPHHTRSHDLSAIYARATTITWICSGQEWLGQHENGEQDPQSHQGHAAKASHSSASTVGSMPQSGKGAGGAEAPLNR